MMDSKQRIQPYRDRAEAGMELARAIQAYLHRMHQGGTGAAAPLGVTARGLPDRVIGLCRGGVPVACCVAFQLGLPMDFLVVRKIASPLNPELALGAVAEGAPERAEVLNTDLTGVLETHAGWEGILVAARDRAWKELQERVLRYRSGGHCPGVAGKHILLVDDGAATGATMRAAVASMRKNRARRVSVALPVAPEETVAELAREADAVICPWCPTYFLSVGSHYAHFPQVTDDEVLSALGSCVRGVDPETGAEASATVSPAINRSPPHAVGTGEGL